MRAPIWVAFLVVSGCASAPASPPGTVKQPAPPVAENATSAVTLEKAAESGTVDRIGPSDGALTPDGTNDLAFIARAEGPVSALFLVAVDADGKPSGTFQADTLVGSSESPSELGAKPGNGTAGLGVFEGSQVLNAQDGTLQGVGPGPHVFTLYVAPSPAITAGTRLRVYVQRPDKTLVASAATTN